MRTRIILAAIFGLAVVAAALGGAWYLLNKRETKVCPFSGRAIQPRTRAIVTVGGKKYETCCVRCAIIEAQQTGKPLHIVKVANFETGKLLNPGSAWFVEGSTVNFCARMAPGTQSPGREATYVRAFDRCSPSALAFSTEEDARAFIARAGGALVRLNDLEREAASTDPKVQRHD